MFGFFCNNKMNSKSVNSDFREHSGLTLSYSFLG